MKKLIAITFVTITLILIAPWLYGQKTNQTDNSKTIEEFRSMILDKMQNGHLVGVGAALIIGDSVVWKEGFGYADKENKIPFTAQTVMNIGSITKPFTAMGVMQLHEKNLLNIDNPLVKYLPEFKIKTRGKDIHSVTVRSVIQHTSGIPNEILLNTWAENENYTNTVEYLKNEYLGYPVNMVYHYSNVGYCLLGHTILKVSKQEYPDYIRDHILKPVGMNNSGFMDYCTLKNLSKSYDSTGTSVVLKKSRNIPAGGLYSTIDDMAKFAREIIAIYNGKRGGFLKPETLKTFEKQNNDNIENFNNCLAWTVFKNDSCLLIQHGGSNHLANSVISIDLKRRSAIIFFVNTLGGRDLIDEAFCTFLETSGAISADYVHRFPYENSISNRISADSLKLHAGLYIYSDASNIVKFENDKLILNSVYGDFQLKPQTTDVFVPGIIKPDTIKWLAKPRFIFSEVMGYKLLFWQDANYKRQLLGHLVIPIEINGIWRNRLGKYTMDKSTLGGWDKFSEAELLIGDNNLLLLKIFYASGEYLYNLRIENDNELITCGFGEIGGETISFSKENQKDILKFDGLTMRKGD
ncbi:MAG: serine hydrolase domain-containing protein [Bacteroidales bacterium]